MWERLSVTDEPVHPAAGADANEAGRMRQALTEIRREGWKVAVIYATLDAALVTLGTNLVLSVWQPPFLPARVPIPEAGVTALRSTIGLTLADPTVGTSAIVGVILGVVAFSAEVTLRVRRPLIEQFEAANPGLRESLRTARDALAADTNSRIARRLYEDVLSELRRSSSLGLVDLRRVTATVVLVAIVSLASIQLAVIDISIGAIDGPGDGTPGDTRADEYSGLQDGSSILGEAEDVPTGENSMDALIGTTGSGGSDGTGDDPAVSYDTSGFAAGTSIESQQAGFSGSEQLEDAALIREYNLRIREGGDA